jgi:hypothetical protein
MHVLHLGYGCCPAGCSAASASDQPVCTLPSCLATCSVYVSINNKEYRLEATPQGSNPQTIQVGTQDPC